MILARASEPQAPEDFALSRRGHVATALFATDFSRWLRGQYLGFLSRLESVFSAIKKPG